MVSVRWWVPLFEMPALAAVVGLVFLLSAHAMAASVEIVTCGRFHSLALVNGTVVGWGRAAEGQIAVPSGVTAIKQMSAAETHSLLQTEDGWVFALGSNANGAADVPTLGRNVSIVSTSASHSLARFENELVS